MINIKNKYYSFVFDENKGKIIDYNNGEYSVSRKQPSILCCRFLNESRDFVRVDVSMARECKVVNNQNSYTVSYSNFDGIRLHAELTISYDETPFLKFGVQLVCDIQLEWVQYPCINVINNFRENGGEDLLLWPYNEGVLVDSIDDRQRFFCYQEPEYPSKGNYGMCPGMVSTPMLAHLSGGNGLYIAAHNKNAGVYLADFCPENDGVSLIIRAYPGVRGGNYRSDYSTVLSLFRGDWYTAADIYRDWFDMNKSDEFVKTEENSVIPQWYRESPIVITYCVRGVHDTDIMNPNKLFPYVNGLPLVEELAEKLDSKILVLLMHWEGTAPWAPPYVWPPYGGEKALKEYIDALHERGHRIGVYCSGLGWTEKSNVADYCMERVFTENRLLDHMCLSPKGDLPYGNICRAQRVGYDICVSTDFCKDIIASEVKKIAASGIDYIQLLDQNHGGTPYFCYSEKHGHPSVPGVWQNTEFRKLIEAVRQGVDNQQLLLGCESAAAEAFIPQLLLSDNRFELNFLFGRAVPLYSYLYHPYLNNFMGNQVCGEWVFDCTGDKNNLFFRIAYSYIAGDFITLVVNENGDVQWAWGQHNFDPDYMPDKEKVLRFVRNLNAVRKEASHWLHTGRQVRPLELTTEGTSSVTVQPGKKIFPSVLTSCYEYEGKLCQFFVNYTEKAQDIWVGKEKIHLTIQPLSSETLKFEYDDHL